MLSVLQQDYPNLEYWVMDGGSTDGSVEIIKKYASQLTGWISEKDAGQADGINKGFARANGDVIAWLNSDDLYLPGAISAAVKALQEHPEAGMVFSDVQSIDANGEAFNLMRYGEWGLPELITFHIIGQPGVFMRRSVLERTGYLDQSYRYLLDHHLWLRIGLISGVQYVPGHVWAAARIHPDAKNVAQAERFGEEAARLAQWMMADPRFAKHTQGTKQKIWAGAHRLDGFYSLDSDKPGEALKAYWQGFCKYPPAVLKDWRRILYALAAPLGLSKLRTRYLQKRKARYQKNALEINNDPE